MSIKVEMPPSLNGGAEQQLRQLYGYLYRLSENLNVALNNLPENRTGGAAAVSGGSGQGGEGTKRDLQTYNELRSLIINTAEITRTEMDKLETDLGYSFEALSSQWGTFQEGVDARITVTARDVVQQLNYDARLDTLDSQTAGFEAYQIRSEGYIRSGFVDYDANGVPVVGIAIGQNLTSTTVTVDGVPYEQIDKSQSCAFYTADRVSFRINGVEVAYVSNRKLYIHDMEITGDVVFGPWYVSGTNGLVIKWIGG